jgi:hypothetical protein
MSTKVVKQHEKDGAAQSHVRPVGKRPVPFMASFLVAFGFLPALYAISRWVYLWDQATGVMMADGWLISGFLVALVAIAIGLFQAKRTTFVIKHVATTVILLGLAANITTLVGWHNRFWDVVLFFATLILWASWMLYRIDVFRAKATGESADGWGDIIGLARSRPKNIKVTEAQVLFDVEHGPGETHQDVVRGIAQAADAAGVITGRATVTEDERGGTSHVAWSMADAFAHWRMFPGPSHPGATFAMPFRTAYYENGDDEWFSFTPNPFASPLTSFRAPQATFVGAAGATGMGKSGFLNNVAAEGLTRVDANVIWVDAEKLFQNAGWCLDQLALAAGSPEQARTLTHGLRGLAEYRVQVLGQAALNSVMDPSKPMMGREWSPTVARELRMGAVLIIVDEADTIIKTKAWEWLAARGRSLGFFLCVGAPRVSTAEVSALLRGSVATWKTFGMGDNYSGMFTLPDDVRETVQPERLREGGLHYLTGAPGVPRQQWSWLSREFQNDTRLLRQMVTRARATYEPIGFTEEEQRWLGKAWEELRPEVLMAIRVAGPTRSEEDGPVAPVPEDPTRRGDETPTQSVAAPVVDDDEDEEGKGSVKTSATGTVVDDDDPAAMDQTAIDPETAREMAGVDPSVPFDTRVPPGESVDLPHVKPQVSEAEQAAALDAVLVAFADRADRQEFGNQDVQDVLLVEISASTLSRRLHELAEGTRLTPPGLELERVGTRGRFRIIRTKPKPRR